MNQRDNQGGLSALQCLWRNEHSCENVSRGILNRKALNEGCLLCHDAILTRRMHMDHIKMMIYGIIGIGAVVGFMALVSQLLGITRE